METRTETCLVCLKNNYSDKNLILFDLYTVEWENVTYLTKLENFLNAQIVTYQTSSICSSCLTDLNVACEFKERVVRALDYWTVKLEESVNSGVKQTEKIEVSNLDDNNISELSVYNEVIDITVAENQKTTEPENIQTLNSDNKNDYFDCSTFPCDKCDYIFVTASELIHHSCKTSAEAKKNAGRPLKPKKRIKKQKSDSFNCELCELSFSKKWKLNKHLKLHTVDKKFVCTFCNRAFKQSYHLREHITTHTGERNFPCNVCSKTFQRISSQRRHMRTHVAMPGEKSKKSPFLCNICGKSFPYSNGAQRHMRIHTGDRRYECNICGRKFSQSTHLKVHLVRVHSGPGEKQYQCNTCGEAFSIKVNLIRHKKGHNDSKDDIKILHSLEPNLSETKLREHNDEAMKLNEFVNDGMPLYDSQGFLVACNQ